ncbi:tRNA-binding protein [Novacetimonas hansenii]|uniref:tRNA-binding protein n=1 Tax=Novacetimonas hansenii TaxID=436 RepID=UPI000A4253FE
MTDLAQPPVPDMSAPDVSAGAGMDGHLDIRVGTILEASPLSDTYRDTYRLRIDFGPHIGARTSAVRVNHRYTPSRLAGRQVCAIVNVPPRQIGPFRSEVLTLSMRDQKGEAVLIRPDSRVPDGGKLF